jgi:N-terminal acetyltransferase B complex non-catalytic subunit
MLILPSQQTFADVTRCVNALKIVRLLGDEATEEDEKKAAEGYLRRYYETFTDSIPAIGKDLPPTELQPADDFALLACQAYVNAYHLSRWFHPFPFSSVYADLFPYR